VENIIATLFHISRKINATKNSTLHDKALCNKIIQYSKLQLKAKFHYAIWSQTGPKLVAERSEAKSHYAIWSQTGPKLVADLQRAGIWHII